MFKDDDYDIYYDNECDAVDAAGLMIGDIYDYNGLWLFMINMIVMWFWYL